MNHNAGRRADLSVPVEKEKMADGFIIRNADAVEKYPRSL